MTIQCAELVVHSANRTLTPENKTSVNNYTWDVGKTLKNVRAIEVLYAEIPNSYYNIYEGANTFHIVVDGVTRDMTIPAGNYNNTTIVTIMNTALSEITLTVGSYSNMGQLFEVGVDAAKSQLMIRPKVSHATSWSITASTWPYALGWLTDVSFASMVANALSYAGGILRLAAESCIYLSIKELGTRGSRYTFGTNSLKSVHIDADHVLTRFQTSGSVNYMNFFNNELNMHERHFDASPPLHLQKLTFQFLRSDGTLIDFNGFDHGLHMRVIYDE